MNIFFANGVINFRKISLIIFVQSSTPYWNPGPTPDGNIRTNKNTRNHKKNILHTHSFLREKTVFCGYGNALTVRSEWRSGLARDVEEMQIVEFFFFINEKKKIKNVQLNTRRYLAFSNPCDTTPCIVYR